MCLFTSSVYLSGVYAEHQDSSLGCRGGSHIACFLLEVAFYEWLKIQLWEHKGSQSFMWWRVWSKRTFKSTSPSNLKVRIMWKSHLSLINPPIYPIHSWEQQNDPIMPSHISFLEHYVNFSEVPTTGAHKIQLLIFRTTAKYDQNPSSKVWPLDSYLGDTLGQ